MSGSVVTNNLTCFAEDNAYYSEQIEIHSQKLNDGQSEVIWKAPPKMFNCCCCKGKNVWSNTLVILGIVELSVLVYGITMIEVFPNTSKLNIIVYSKNGTTLANIVSDCIASEDNNIQC